jgi:tetratricopeptide (TPR) repeat protein
VISDRLVEGLKKYAKHDLNIANLLSHYFIMKKDMKSSYRIMKSVDVMAEEDSVTHYEKVSDLAWSMQDVKASAEASKKLHALDKARLEDYERIFYYYNKRDPKLLQEASLRAYEKYKKDYIFMNYINLLNNNKEYERLAQTFETMKHDKNMIAFKKTTPYWLMKGQMHGQLKEYEEARHAFEQAMKLAPNSANIQSTLMWAVIDSKDTQSLEKMIFDLEEGGEIHPELWLPVAVGHFQMQRSDRALNYIKKMMRKKDANVDTKFMYAYLMQVRNDEEAFMGTMRDIFTELDRKRKANPSLMRQKEFLKNYLNAGMYILPVDEFDALLYQSRKLLSKKQFTELALYWAMLNDAQERATYLAQSLNTIEPWLKLNRAMHYDDRNKQLDILYSYMSQLPIRDRVTAAENTGNIALAQTLAFEGMENNRYDHQLYQQNLNLVEQYVDTFTLETGYQTRTGLNRSYIKGKNRFYLLDGWRLLTDFEVNQESNTGRFSNLNTPENSGAFHMGLQKNFLSGYVNFQAGVISSLEDYFSASAMLHYQLTKNLIVETTVATGKQAQETLLLLHGGKKDLVSAQLNWQYVPSSQLSLYLEYDRFFSQDDYVVGDGFGGRVDWRKQIRYGYPDMAWGFSYMFGQYEEEPFTKGVIEQIRPNTGFRVLPENFHNVCSNFSYGMANKEQYTRVWRPFGEFSPCYNVTTQEANLFFSGGIGGSLYDKDHLFIGVKYDQAAGGTQETNLELFLRYKVFY